MKQIPSLTDKEIEILKAGKNNPSIITDYFMRPYGAKKGFRFDENFTPEGIWQREFYFAKQKDRRCSAGIGTGKTLAAAQAYCVVYPLLIHPNYKFMNVAPTAYQAAQMYQMIIDMSRDTPYERLIYKAPESPYRMIELRFKVNSTLVVSTMQFASIDGNAKAIFSFEGDIIHIDEAAQIQKLEEVLISVGSRLRGSFRGRERLGILSMTTNPWDNPYFWYLFDMAKTDPNVLSMVVSTKSNKNISDAQLESILKRIPEEQRSMFIEGERPEGMGSYFSKKAIERCCSTEFSEWILGMEKAKQPGYFANRHIGIGYDYYHVPFEYHGDYMIFGDMGTDAAPNRNSPVIIVLKTNNVPNGPAEIVCAWWGNGNKSIAPFALKLAELMQEYRPLYTFVDSTGTQKNTAETMNAMYFPVEKTDMSNVFIFGKEFNLNGLSKIQGLSFSNKKYAYLISALFMLEAGMLKWPSFFSGFRSQLANYDPLLDIPGNPKIAQDLVCVIAMASFVLRRTYYLGGNIDEELTAEAQKDLYLRTNRSARSSNRKRGRKTANTTRQGR